MSAIYPLNIHRRIERQWASRVKWLDQVRGQIVVAAGRTLQHLSNQNCSLIPIPVRAKRGPAISSSVSTT
jgi:hypothetical protein